jgi:hypothetical protein
MDYREELELAIDGARESLPKAAYGAASYSLHYGPSGGGADMSWDEAIAALRDWADGIDDAVLTDFAEDDDGEETEYEIGHLDAGDIVAGVIGRELARYL